jgi:hypothetical protein
LLKLFDDSDNILFFFKGVDLNEVGKLIKERKLEVQKIKDNQAKVIKHQSSEFCHRAPISGSGYRSKILTWGSVLDPYGIGYSRGLRPSALQAAFPETAVSWVAAHRV